MPSVLFPKNTVNQPVSFPRFSRARRGTADAFSLVEVVIALGIVALSLVTMVGMIPVGLSSMRDAMDATTKAQITQRITSQVMTIPFAQIPAVTTGEHIYWKTYYFDQEGFEQGSVDRNGTRQGTSPDLTTRFQVVVSSTATEYPGAAGTMSDSIVTLRLHMTFYGRDTVAADVALGVPNQSGKSGIASANHP